MIKKNQKRLIYATYQRDFLKQLLRKTFEREPTKENPNIEENLCLMDKVINVVELLVQSDGVQLLLLNSSCSHDGEKCNKCVNL